MGMHTCEDIATHVCEELAEKRLATPEAPYHYVGSGLPNVYLTGITYYVCSCGKQSAEIPAMRDLFAGLARVIVSKPSPLTGLEFRFLRKDLRKKAVEFASLISLTPEHLSRLENSSEAVDVSRDKLMRVIYSALSSDKRLKNVFEKGAEFERWKIG